MANICLLSDNFSPSRLGLGRYAMSLSHSLAHEFPNQSFKAGYVLESQKLSNSEKNNLEFKKVGWGRRVTAACWTWFNQPKVEFWLRDVDLIHSLECEYTISTDKPLVVTIHDIGPLTHPEYFSASRPGIRKIALEQAIQKADSIITVSEYTANDVQSYFQVDLSHKLHVIPEGISSVFQKKPSESTMQAVEMLVPQNKPYFLYPGSINPRKNLSRVLKAFESVAQKIPHDLIIVGKLGWESNSTLQHIKNTPFAKRIHLVGFVKDEQLAALYRKATALVYVSLFEGFGLPIVEAMASGCPVITSNISPMSEVAGDSAVLVDPLSTKDISRALLDVGKDSSFRDSIVKSGHGRAQLFSWKSNACRTMQIYKEILG